MSVKLVPELDLLKKWMKRNAILLDYLLVAAVILGILLFGIYAEFFGGLVAGLIEQIRELF